MLVYSWQNAQNLIYFDVPNIAFILIDNCINLKLYSV